MTHDLAIVIPAYKIDFFDETLKSISDQSCKDFTLYIGDDASPDNLNDLVSKYTGLIDIVYKRFNENLGGRDLVAQWHRCIDLIQNEDWIWLFSDDDIMEAGCVERFYKCLEDKPLEDVLHFNVKVIDNSHTQILESKPFPVLMSSSEFFKLNTTWKIDSFMVEFVFTRSVYQKTGGFVNFDLAWCADSATWMKFSRSRGIRTIEGSEIYWRYSGQNITSRIKDAGIIDRKVMSTIEYLLWARNFFEINGLADTTSEFEKLKIVLSLICNSSTAFFGKLDKILESNKRLGYKGFKILSLVYLVYMTVKIKVIGRQFRLDLGKKSPDKLTRGGGLKGPN